MLRGGAVIGVGLASGATLTSPAHGAADEFEVLRDRWCELITGAADIDLADPRYAAVLNSLDSGIASYLSSLDRSSGRTQVFANTSLTQRTDSSKMTATYGKLRWMAIGWYTPGSAYFHDASLLVDIRAGLATTRDLVYKPATAEFGNWWDFEIGSPKRLADILLLLDTELTAAERSSYVGAIRHFVPDPWLHDGVLTTAANRTSMCSLAILDGIAGRSASRIAHAAEGIAVTCEFVGDKPDGTANEGLWADGSYIQHQHAYTGSYGRVILNDISLLYPLLAGSTWALDDPALQNLFDAVDIGFAPVIHDGRLMSFVNGRRVAEPGEQEHQTGLGVIVAILRLVRTGAVDVTTLNRWRGRCRGWLDRAAYDPYAGGDAARVSLLHELFDSSAAALPEPANSVVFRNMARAVHRRNGWAFAISMSSNRIGRFESINGENLQGWHTGAGMTYLYDSDFSQYTDGFWPVVNPLRLPGTTIDRTVIAPQTDGDAGGQQMPTSKWAGGAVLDDTYSVVGMTLQAAASSLTGRKSWFCFDEFVFCIGRSIAGGNGTAVETIVENRNLHVTGTNPLLIDGTTWTGADQTITGPTWAHLAGVGGYVFPASASPVVRFRRNTRTGRWSDINAGGSSTDISRRWLEIAIQHGANPTDGVYSYLVVPGATPERTEYLATVNRGVEVRATNARCHAVRQNATGLAMFNFWLGPTTVDRVTVDKECAVVTQELSGTLKIAVANPVRNGATVRVEVTPVASGYHLVAKDPGVTVVSTGSVIKLDVATSVYGKTFEAEFAV